MTVTVRNNADLIVPPSVRRRAGLKAGDKLEFTVSGGTIHIVPKPAAADCEYTPQQRRIIDREIAKGLEDIKKGALHGPFDTHEAMIEFLHAEVAKARRVVKTSKSR